MAWTVFKCGESIIDGETMESSHYSKYQILFIRDERFCVTDVHEYKDHDGELNVEVTLERI